MTDEELCARLRDLATNMFQSGNWGNDLVTTKDAADRIEALTKERDEAWKRAAHAEKMWGEAEINLAKAVEALDRLVALNDDYSPFGGEMFQDRVERTWQKARATLAEISSEAALNKGESHD